MFSCYFSDNKYVPLSLIVLCPNVISTLTSVLLHHRSIISPINLLNILELGYNLWIEFKPITRPMQINFYCRTTVITLASSPINPITNYMYLSVIVFWTYAHLSAKKIAFLSPQILRIISSNSSCSFLHLSYLPFKLMIVYFVLSQYTELNNYCYFLPNLSKYHIYMQYILNTIASVLSLIPLPLPQTSFFFVTCLPTFMSHTFIWEAIDTMCSGLHWQWNIQKIVFHRISCHPTALSTCSPRLLVMFCRAWKGCHGYLI